MLQSGCGISVAVVIFSLTFQCCRPAVETYLRDVALNYEETGFLTADILQVHCRQNIPESGIPADREGLINQCREILLEEILQYRANYELNRRSLLQTSKPLPAWSYRVSLSAEQRQKLRELYSDLLPGNVVYEEQGHETLTLVYRLERKNLAKEIQKRDWPFQLEIAQE